jgi:hypothetical protein
MKLSQLNENKEKIITQLREEILQKDAIIATFEEKEREYQQALSRLKIQYEVTKLLVDATSFEQVCEKILQVICENLNFQRAFFWIYNPNIKTLSYGKAWNIFLEKSKSKSESESEFELISRKISFLPGIGLPGRIMTSGRPNWIVDVVKDNNFLRASVAEKLGIHSAFGFPISIGYKILGTMEFFTPEFRVPDEKLLDLMLDIGNQIGEFNWRNSDSKLLAMSNNF